MPSHAARRPSIDLGQVEVFTAVVREGSFTRAATRLGLPKSTVSRKVAELEARIGALLLHRTTRRLALTDVGRAYYEHSARAMAELEEAAQAVSGMQAEPAGTLRVTVPPAFAVLGPILAEYLQRFPKVDVQLVSTDRAANLVEERFDLALRAGRSPDSTLVSRRLGTVRRCLFASAPLAQRLRGKLRRVGDLADHPCLAFAPEGSRWSLSAGGKAADVSVRPRLVTNDYDTLRALARAGAGIALLPEYQCADDLAAGRLVRVLEDWSADEVPLFALYPSARYPSPRLNALLDLLGTRLAAALAPAKR